MIRMHRTGVSLLLWLLIFLAAAATAGAVKLENDYIAIIVNDGENNAGRFSINTTGGDPDREDDDFSTLIYGSDNPWTSYTTVRVDGRDYVFGGPTEKRAGRSGTYGEVMSSPTLTSGSIECAWQLGPAAVHQSLSFAESSTTGLPDTARIVYTIENCDDQEHKIGLRIVLDTMLGVNDGAPFRVHDQALTTDTVFFKSEMPEFWQAFDSLSEPKVMAQGTLRGGEVTTPDRVYFTNWGSLADSPWDPDFVPGRDFTRKGEFELDSAIALYYEPQLLKPGEKRIIIAYYGLGGVTIRKGDLSLGVTAPASTIADPDDPEPFPIVAYIENTGKGEARELKAVVELPDQLRLVEGQKEEKALGRLPVGETVQVQWMAVPTGKATGEVSFTVSVDALNTDPNAVTRSIELLSPARLAITLGGINALEVVNNRYEPDPFAVVASIANQGGAPAYSIQATIESPVGLTLAEGEDELKFITMIESGETKTVRWHLTPSGRNSGRLPYSVVTVQSKEQERTVANGFISVPTLESLVKVTARKDNGFIKAEVDIDRVPDLKKLQLSILYDPQVLRLVGGRLGIDKGALLTRLGDEVDFQVVELDEKQGLITVRCSGDFGDGHISGNILGLRFQRLASREAAIVVDSVSLLDGKNMPIAVEVRDAVLE